RRHAAGQGRLCGRVGAAGDTQFRPRARPHRPRPPRGRLEGIRGRRRRLPPQADRARDPPGAHRQPAPAHLVVAAAAERRAQRRAVLVQRPDDRFQSTGADRRRPRPAVDAHGGQPPAVPDRARGEDRVPQGDAGAGLGAARGHRHARDRQFRGPAPPLHRARAGPAETPPDGARSRVSFQRESKAMIVLLLLATLVQGPETLSGVVKDATGLPMQGAVVTATAGTIRETATTAADGSWSLRVSGATTVALRVDAQGFAAQRREVTLPSAPIVIELRPQAIAEQVTVSAESAPTRLSVDSSVTSIDHSTMVDTPALRLDDQLRSVPGCSLFRRTPSAVANPTTQGVTLRGLSASGASRTLVVADDVPLNDPFGAWVYWNRVPVAALQRVDVVRGASGDIHGNDALGGVIRLTTRTGQGGEAWFEGGNLGNVRGSFYGALTRGSWLAGAAAESGTTDGFIVVAPEARGPIDVNADSKGTSAMGWAGGAAGAVQLTARGGYFTEDRGNGTPAQVNGTVTRWGSVNSHGLAFGGLWEARGDFT